MCGRKRVESLHRHAHMLSQAPGSGSILGYSIQELQCQWQCYKLQGTENPLIQCPCIIYAAASPYCKCLRVIWNITVGLHACLPNAECAYAVDLLDPLSKSGALTPFLQKRWNLKMNLCHIYLCGCFFTKPFIISCACPKAKYYLPLFCHELESSSFSIFFSQTGCWWWVKWFVQGAERLVVHVGSTGKSVFNSLAPQ